MMSSSLSELRNFRLNKNKPNTNGINPSSKLATGRKRIRAMSDSSDDEHTNKQTLPQKSKANGTDTILSTADKEERYNIFREIADSTIESIILQDFLVRNDWDVQKAYEALQESQEHKKFGEHSSPIKQNVAASSNHSVKDSTKTVREQKPKVISIDFN